MNATRLESLIEVAARLAEQSDFEKLLRLVTEQASSLLKANVALIMMVSPLTQETIKTIHRARGEVDNQTYHFMHTNLSGWVIHHNSGFFSGDLQQDTRFSKSVFDNIALKSGMCAPLRAEGIIIGVLLLFRQAGSVAFSKEDYAFLEKFTPVVSPFLRNLQKIQPYFISPLLEETLLQKYISHHLLGKSKKFTELLRTIEAAVHCDVRILLEGETGPGKELIARAIHRYSSHAQHKFVAIDCGAIPAHLLESELFGHVKGTFTGATGRFQHTCVL